MSKNLMEEISNGDVLVLRSGEEKETERGFYAPASITLIKDPRGGIIVDVGCFGEEEIIKELLLAKGFSLKQIEKVIITHNHPDHLGNVGMFRNNNSKIYMPDSSFSVTAPNYFGLMPDKFYESPGKKIYNQDSKVNIISTPGHSGWDISVLYKGKEGTIAIVGDLFWSQKDWKEDSEFLGLCVNPKMQKISRKYVKEKLRPSVIIPGHGPAFATKYL